MTGKPNILQTCILFISIFISACINAQPPLAWAKQIDSYHTSSKHVIATELDKAGNLFILGEFRDTVDFDPSPLTLTLAATDVFNPFIMKMTAQGQVLWARTISNPISTNVFVRGLESDSLGNVYLAGRFTGFVDFDPGPGTFNLPGGDDCFLLKLDASGNFVWVKQFKGGNGHCEVHSFTFDSELNIYLTGGYSGNADLDPGITAYCPNTSQIPRGFVVKISKSGVFRWAKAIDAIVGWSGTPWGHFITADKQDNIFFGGKATANADMDPGPGVVLTATDCAFVCKLDSFGNYINSFHFYGNHCFVSSILCSDGLYITGTNHLTPCDLDPGPGQYSVAPSQGWVSYFLKLNNAGSFIWAKVISPQTSTLSSVSMYNHIQTCATKDLFFYTSFAGNYDFDPGPAVSMLSSKDQNGNSQDLACACYDSLGNYKWAYSLGRCSNGWNSVRLLSVSKYCDVYTSAAFRDTLDIDPTAAVSTLIPLHGSSIFIQKLSVCQPTNLPMVSLSAESATICLGDNTGLFASGGNSYEWSHNLPSHYSVHIAPSVSTVYELTVTNLSGCKNTSSIFISVLKCSDIVEIQSDQPKIFPNPTSSKIFINNVPNSNLLVFDCSGKCVYEEFIFSEKAQIDLRELESGLYFLSIVKNGQVMTTQKIFLE